MAGRDEYFEVSKRVGALVDYRLKAYLHENLAGKQKKILYSEVLKKKTGKQKLRANILYLAYCAFTNKDPRDSGSFTKGLINLCTAVELLIASQYMVNWIYDLKADVENEIIRKKTAVSANSLLNDAIELTKATGTEYIMPMLKINDYVIASFTPEITGMNITNRRLLNNKKLYFSRYDKEYAIPGVGEFFSGLVEIAAILSCYKDKKKVKGLAEVFCEFGKDLETLNALGDFVLDMDLTHWRSPSDQYSDIKNNTLTPPIWYLYNNMSKEAKKTLLSKAGTPLSLREKKYFLRQLFETGTYAYVVSYLRHQWRTYKKQVLRLGLPKSASYMICQLLSLQESNKIYHQLLNNYSSLPRGARHG